MIKNPRLARFIRGGLLVLLVISFLGPWLFDKVMVPGEFPCNPPTVRLDDKFCGFPMSYGYFVVYLIRSSLSAVRSELTPAPTLLDLTREYSFYFVFFLAALPFFSTLLLLWKPGHRSLRIFNWICWGLAGLIALVPLIASEMLHPALWGIWLYRLVVILALVWEWTQVRSRKIPGA